MPTTIPLGFHIWSMSFSCSGSTHTCVTTHAGRNGTFLTAASINAVWRANFTGGTAPANAASIATGWTVQESKVLANIGGVLQSDTIILGTTGTGAAAVTPINTALLVRKRTGFAGRRYQARMFWPPFITEVDVNNAGVIAGSALTVWNAKFTTVLNAIIAAGIDPVLLHDPALGVIPTAVNQWDINPRIGTIGRRLRR